MISIIIHALASLMLLTGAYHTGDTTIHSVATQGAIRTGVHYEPYNGSNSAMDPFEGYSRLREVCLCESNLSHYEADGKTILRGRDNSDDVGICQINEEIHKEEIKINGFNIYSEEGNIAFAKHLYEEQGLKPWNSSKKCWKSSISR